MTPPRQTDEGEKISDRAFAIFWTIVSWVAKLRGKPDPSDPPRDP